MRTIPAAVQSKLDSNVATLAYCWTIVRRDGETLRFTSFHNDLVVDGNTFEANSAIMASTLKQTSTLSVDNLTISGIISSLRITVRDILSGLYDYASVEFCLVDYLLPEEGKFCVVNGSFGEIQARSQLFEAEFRLLVQSLSKKVVGVTSRDCRVMEFGDSQCGVNLAAHTFSSTVGSGMTPTRYEFVGTGTGVTGKADNYFAQGKLTWITGNNSGVVCDVKESDTGTGRIELQRALFNDIEIGDEFEIVAGCNRSFEDCKSFGNSARFRGEPHLRGPDYLIRVAVK